MRRRGLTVVEISYVLAVIAIVSAITIPTYDVLVRRAKADEARSMLAAIHHAELTHWRDHGAWLGCPASGPVPRGASASLPADECWGQLLGESTEGLRYRYSVQVEGDECTIIAEGDLDADGRTSEFRLDARTQRLTTKDELE
ncbi:MAG: type IV pilin protein [Myxococcota bacterium]